MTTINKLDIEKLNEYLKDLDRPKRGMKEKFLQETLINMEDLYTYYKSQFNLNRGEVNTLKFIFFYYLIVYDNEFNEKILDTMLFDYAYIPPIELKQEQFRRSFFQTENFRIYFSENDFVDIDMSTLSAEQFAEILKNAVSQGIMESRQQVQEPQVSEFGILEENIPEEETLQDQFNDFSQMMAQSQLGVAQGIHALAQATAMNKMSDFMNEYRGMTREELIQQYENFGVNYVQNSKEEESTEDLLRKIDFMKSLKKQSEVLADLKYNRKSTVEEGYNRITWDMFEKLSNEKLKSGVPFETIIKYIQGIPNSKIRFSKDDGKFNVIQEKDIQKFNTYKEAKRFAESGSFYSRDLRILRKINNEFEKKKKMYDIVWNARTY